MCIIVLPQYRRRKVASILSEESIKIGKQLGYKFIFSDIYCLNLAGIQFARFLNFSVIANIPKSGYFSEHGYVDTCFYATRLNGGMSLSGLVNFMKL